MAEDNTPKNVVDEGIELYHSISKGETVNKNFHAGTYNAALDRASQFYGGEQLYKIANDNLDFIQDQANDLISELSEEVSFEKVQDFYEVTDGMVTREIDITLPTGNETKFNIVAETSNNDLIVKFQDLDGYDGAEIYSETLWDIEYEPDNLKSVTSTIDIIGDENVAEGLLDEIGLKSQAGEFNYKDGYDLYKVNIKPGANVVNIPDTAIFVEFGIEKEMSSDFIQGFIERPKEVDSYKNVTQIKIDGKTYDITDTFTSSQALQEHFKGADVLVYNNDIEDVGSKSYMFLNENSYVLEKIDDTQFNIDVANKYIKNNPYETISKLARREAFTEPKRYQVLLNALLDETDTPTNVVDTVGGKSIKTKTFLDDLPLIQHPETFEGEEIIDKLMERPSGQTVEEFITENNLTQREIDIINNNFDEARRIEDYLEIKKGVSPEELRISIENVGQKTPNQIVTRYIDDAYKTFDKVNFPNTALKEQALLRLNKRLLTTLGTVKEWIYDPKGGGALMGEGTKLNEYLLNVQEIYPTEQIDPAGNLINTEQKILDELGVKQLGEGSYWDNVIRGVVINAQEDLTIEGEVIPNTPQLETPTQALDELDDAISKADGIDNLNKAKDIINKNPGVFKKIFSVLEKADIGDQVITKAIIPKVLPRIGLAAATGPVGMAYAAYEIALLLSDVGQAAYKAQTTDESFWDNFGEISDKYSIAYKISKPVYDIILDNLNNDLTEEEDEEILFSFNR